MDLYNSFIQTFSLEPTDPPMILIMAVLFALFWKLLMERGVFKPQMEAHADRASATSGLRTKALGLTQEAEALRERYDGRINQVRMEVLSWKESELAVARKEAAEILARGEEEAQKLLAAGREETARYSAEARASAKARVAELADSVTGAVTNALRVH